MKKFKSSPFFSQFICRWRCWCQNKRYISIFFQHFCRWRRWRWKNVWKNFKTGCNVSAVDAVDMKKINSSSFFSQFICRWRCWCQNKRYISIFFKTITVFKNRIDFSALKEYVLKWCYFICCWPVDVIFLKSCLNFF